MYSYQEMARSRKSGGKSHRFGGDWTSAKLEVLSKYLESYATALKNTRFKKAYIDAFAGTGYRDAGPAHDDGRQEPLFPDLAGSEPQNLLDGSARLALKTKPEFDRYIFIEKSVERCEQLNELRTEFPDLAGTIDVRQGDANTEIRSLCERSWATRRAVLFLDPYGMQVEWQTIEAIAATKAIDLWILFPLGIGVNRLLTRSGNIPVSWRRKLDTFLGTEDWYEDLYRVEPAPTLFGTDEARVVKATREAIGRYFVDRLKSVFPGVIEEPAVLRNSANCPLYLFCFAAGNERGARVALRIAEHLLKGVR